MENWDQPARPKGSCDRCGNLTRIVMGQRGPIKVPLAMTRIGYFSFCEVCIEKAEHYEQSFDYGFLLITKIDGHKFITGHKEKA